MAISADPPLADILYATLVNSALFNSELIISDAQLFRSRNLHELLLSARVRQVLEASQVKLATRAEVHTELPAMYARYLELGTISEGQVSRLLTDRELEELSSLGKATWSYRRVTESFVRQATNLIRQSPSLRKAGEVPAEEIVLALHDVEKARETDPRFPDHLYVHEGAKTSKLGIDAFQREIWQSLEKRGFTAEAHTRAHVQDLAQTAYMLGLPSALSASPICAENQYDKINFVAGDSENAIFDIATRLDVDTPFSKSDYVYGLSLLSPRDIAELRASDEFSIFQGALEKQTDPRSPNKNLVNAIGAYTTLVDETILRAGNFLSKPLENSKRRIEIRRSQNIVRDIAGFAYSNVISIVSTTLGIGPLAPALEKAIVILPIARDKKKAKKREQRVQAHSELSKKGGDLWREILEDDKDRTIPRLGFSHVSRY